MRRVVLLCAQGMSTSMLVSKIEESAKKAGYELEVSAHPVTQANEMTKDADVVLLGPQVRFYLSKVKNQVNCPVDAIDMLAYGTMDGNAVVVQIKKLLGD